MKSVSTTESKISMPKAVPNFKSQYVFECQSGQWWETEARMSPLYSIQKCTHKDKILKLTAKSRMSWLKWWVLTSLTDGIKFALLPFSSLVIDSLTSPCKPRTRLEMACESHVSTCACATCGLHSWLRHPLGTPASPLSTGIAYRASPVTFAACRVKWTR